MNTLLLDPGTWDLTIDKSRNIAVTTGAYAMAQDAASEIKLFEGELWFDTTRGVPYWTQVLGLAPPLSLVRELFSQAAFLVPGVVTAQVFFTAFAKRKLSGQVQVTNSAGE